MIALDVRELAQSCFRLMTSLMLVDEASSSSPEWDRASSEEQAYWLNIAQKAAKTMLELEGLPLASVAKALFLLGVPQTESDLVAASELYDNVANPFYRLKWEALARHLHALMDCDELRSAEESEQFFLQWYTTKTSTLLNSSGASYVA